MYRWGLGALSLLAACTASADYAAHPRALELAAELEREHGLAQAETMAILAQARRNPKLIQAEQNAAEKTKTWPEYLRLFLQEDRIQGGLDFWAQQSRWLEAAQRQWGVPPEIITAIIGVETRYGGYTGPHRILDSLSTQGFEHPTRQPFFYSELRAFLLLVRERDLDPLALRGSYAGAMGLAQFMPSNYRRLAVDFDRSGDVDLWTPADAIGSAANYLTKYRGEGLGWQAGHPVLVAAVGQAAADWPRNPRIPTQTYADVASRLTAIPGIGLDEQIGLIVLEGEHGTEQWLGLNNFYNLMAYNPRVFYAMAVYRLARAIGDRQAAR